MSCSLYRWTEACDGRPCRGDCDLCSYDPEESDVECLPPEYDDKKGATE